MNLILKKMLSKEKLLNQFSVKCVTNLIKTTSFHFYSSIKDICRFSWQKSAVC